MSEPLYCRTCATINQTQRPRYGMLIPLFSRLLTLAGIVVLIGMLPWLSGQDPALALLRARSGEQEATAETLNAIRHSLGLDQGPLQLLLNWLTGLLHGDAGNSWVSDRPVLPGMLQAAGVSLTLMASSALVAFTLAAVLCVPTFRQGLRGQVHRSGGLFAALFTALPEFLLASFLLIVGAVWLQWFPPYGWLGLHYAVLPSLALGIPAGGYLGRIIADALSATFSENWLTTWSVAGVSRRHVALAVLKRTLPSVMPLVGLVLVSLTGGAIAVEKVFAIPGLGRATLGAAAAQDLPALQIGVLILLLIASLAGIAASGVRLLILGRALRSGAMPVPEERGSPVSRYAIWLPVICVLLLALLLLAGLPRDPYTSAFLRLQPPSLLLPFGADAMGRDLLARVAHGTLNTCLLALVVSLACLAIGLLVGLFPRLLTGPIEVTNALPPVIAGLLVAAVNGPTATGAAIAVIAVSWAPLAAHTAALVAEINARPYIRMLPILGVGPIRRSLFYVLPALIGPLFRHAMLRLPGIALALASLGFLGLGASPPTPEWGRVLAEGMPYIERAFWGVLAPAAALGVLSILAVSAANLSGRHKH
ncbi:ABC transporter permease subunit [Pectobacterium aroidearum]|uniref:ABC transporter permease subunit n=1 Tax=Pectobacterium aroidearum TaxID=1201031 RepID=A0ABR5ZDJ6_9GAMM|nr:MULTISPECIES: ABC transporter permease subunit [Pectobacterium]MBA5199857.1 ABC transporter permease subunit [Pectobacterium aroidearum]MBA5228151.1 ABC transporter permease subunit [Pectobacterium aroidearum]MBA5232649.1 ABC transporter permease subunit [Pectobacterium aroidearum]MBA5737675.1 ABC transporter permease subunit [Pectobacterium aroidearum]UXK01778.1 ABC transporter permease subunit [Pectobacterium aroidearum]